MSQLQSYGLDIAAVLLREAKVYAENQLLKVDIVVHTYYQAPKDAQLLISDSTMDMDTFDDLPRRSFIIELKFESRGSTQKFKSNVIKDLKKIRTGIQINRDYQSAGDIKLAIGISISPEGYAAMDQIQTGDPDLDTKVAYLGRTEHGYTQGAGWGLAVRPHPHVANLVAAI